MSSQKLTYGYWNIRGYGQSIRFLLEYLNVDYDDIVYKEGPAPEFSRQKWFDVKPTLQLDFPNLPYLIDGDFRLTEAVPILKYLARTRDPSLAFNTASPKLLAYVEMLEYVLVSLRNEVAVVCYHSSEGEAYEAVKNGFETRYFPHIASLSKFLGDKDWFLGQDDTTSQLTYLDFLAYETILHYKRYSPTFIAGFANLTKYLERFEAIPQIHNYITKSPRYIDGPLMTFVCPHNIQ